MLNVMLIIIMLNFIILGDHIYITKRISKTQRKEWSCEIVCISIAMHKLFNEPVVSLRNFCVKTGN